MKTIIEMQNTKASRYEFLRLKSVLSCASTDPTREVIRHVSVEPEDEGIRIIATDGRRLRADSFDLQAQAGLYEIKVQSAAQIFLVKAATQLKFPNWRQVLPSLKPEDAHAFKGCGRNFILWITAGLGCLLTPELIALRDEEEITLYIQKQGPGMQPAVMQNDTTIFVQMPIRETDSWYEQIDRIRKAA